VADVDDGEIRSLLARMAHVADCGSVDAYAECFTDDGVWEMPGNPLVGLPADQRSGRDDIAAGVVARRAAGVQGPGTHTMHMLTTTAVTVDGDEAEADSCYLFYGDAAATPALRGIGRYHDVLRRTPDGWKVVRRTVITG
jgi:ketosteroid isomerase-like protein